MPSLTNTYSDSGHLKLAILASLCIHILLFSLFYRSIFDSADISNEIIFSAELVPAPSFQKQAQKKIQPSQIVAPPEKSSELPQETKQVFESDKDNFSPKQQIRRGEEGAALSQNENQQPKAPSQPQTISRVKAEQNEKSKTATQDNIVKKAAAPNTKLNLKLNQDSLAELSASEIENKDPQSTQEKIQEALQAGSQKNERSSINVSRIGSHDYLPDIPDGEVTLLNTKANKYAVFVRRVASQVFANLRGAGWRSLSARDINSINTDGVFEAILSPKGELLSVKLHNSSESIRFDQVLKLAIEKGAKDPNPPVGAEAEDGNIHFTFQARSWVKIGANARNGAPREQRWLMLGTGLD